MVNLTKQLPVSSLCPIVVYRPGLSESYYI
jgi:hypothetical protein